MPQRTIKYYKETNTGSEVELTIEFDYYPGYPAKVSGPPEHCYEGESEHIDILSVRIELPDDRFISVEMDDELELELCTYIEENI